MTTIAQGVTQPVHRTQTFPARGYFDGFMINKKRFEFFNVATGEQYIGRISKAVIKALGGQDIVIGRTSPLYEVKVTMTVAADEKPTYELVELSRVLAT